MRTALAAIDASGVGALLGPLTRGKGVIFTLHSVRPEPPAAFEPNRILKITPAFLEAAIVAVEDAGYDIVSLDEATRRLETPGRSRRFACFTFDDGYRDNRDYAYPIFRDRGLPFAIYVPTAYADGEGDLWWLTLEAALAKADNLRIDLDGVERDFDLADPPAKEKAFDEIYWSLRRRPEAELRATVARIAALAGYDASKLCRDLVMSWDELRALAADPLVTIGAHTRRHFAVGGLSEDEARAEIVESVARIERELGRPCRHFSFPYGDPCSAGPRDFAIARAAGLATAVTTHKDVLRDRYAMTGLPRVSLNGDFQDVACLRAMLTGLPFLLFDAAKAASDRVTGARRALAAGASLPRPTNPGAASIG
jgi:peptidoglycan/xylan/chitin deacetylase (PgdA/CDA1 family)